MHLWKLSLNSCVTALLLLASALPARARMALIVAEPFGSFGTMMPEGHASIYLPDLCVETAVKLRPCQPGEPGAVVSRYHDLRHPELDWLAFPLPVFLYGTTNPGQIPRFMTARAEAEMREQYREQNLLDIIPDQTDRRGHIHKPPYGDWEEGIGAAFDRRLLMYGFDTTPEQDATMLAWLNDRPNRRAYTLGRANCADFAADLLRLALPPDTIHRNVLADYDMTTPKQLARLVGAYGAAHPELHPTVYDIPQLPGTLRRSRPIRGAAEQFLKTKRYLFALLVLQPEVILADWIVYERLGKWTPGLDASVIHPEDWNSETLRACWSQPAVDGPAPGFSSSDGSLVGSSFSLEPQP
ncbi:MAG: hypothetical protein ACRYFU_16880 [Janthinobacterium lividum]